MKKFMKVCAIMALVFGVVGAVLGTVGSRRAGRTDISEVLETVTGGRIAMKSASWWEGWGFRFGDGTLTGDFEIADFDELEELVSIDAGIADYAAEDETGFDKSRDIQRGDVEKYCPGENILRMDMELGGCYLETRESGDSSIYLEARNIKKFQGYVKDGTLYIKAGMETGLNLYEGGENQITLYLPKGYKFEEVEAQVGAGNMFFTDLNAQEVSLDVGAGQITVQDGVIGMMDVSIGAGSVELYQLKILDLEVEVGMGACFVEGAINGYADVECSMGTVEMTLEGSETDFDYYLEGAMGNIELGSESMYGFGQERYIRNNASKRMDIECAMGNITILFKE